MQKEEEKLTRLKVKIDVIQLVLEDSQVGQIVRISEEALNLINGGAEGDYLMLLNPKRHKKFLVVALPNKNCQNN